MTCILCFLTLFFPLSGPPDSNTLLTPRVETGAPHSFHPPTPDLPSPRNFEKMLGRKARKEGRGLGGSTCPQPPDVPKEKKGFWVSKEVEFNTDLVTVSTLLTHPDRYHKKVVRVRGTVTRLELHLDDTELFIDFVFELKDGPNTVVVFGRHDRTRGDIQMTTNHTVEVRGVFWRERMVKDHRLENNLEASSVSFFPSLTPDQARPLRPNRKGHLSLVSCHYSQILRDELSCMPDAGFGGARLRKRPGPHLI